MGRVTCTESLFDGRVLAVTMSEVMSPITAAAVVLIRDENKSDSQKEWRTTENLSENIFGSVRDLISLVRESAQLKPIAPSPSMDLVYILLGRGDFASESWREMIRGPVSQAFSRIYDRPVVHEEVVSEVRETSLCLTSEQRQGLFDSFRKNFEEKFSTLDQRVLSGLSYLVNCIDLTMTDDISSKSWKYLGSVKHFERNFAHLEKLSIVPNFSVQDLPSLWQALQMLNNLLGQSVLKVEDAKELVYAESEPKDLMEKYKAIYLDAAISFHRLRPYMQNILKKIETLKENVTEGSDKDTANSIYVSWEVANEKVLLYMMAWDNVKHGFQSRPTRATSSSSFGSNGEQGVVPSPTSPRKNSQETSQLSPRERRATSSNEGEEQASSSLSRNTGSASSPVAQLKKSLSKTFLGKFVVGKK